MRTLDLAQLYLRIVIGGMLLLHNVAKMQRYNTIIDSYPTWEGLSSGFWFYLFATIQSFAGVMLIIGWHVRLAAAILTAGTILGLAIFFPTPSLSSLEIDALYTFIYIYIFIAGGGLYSLDSIRAVRKECDKER
ncbi:MAG: DoxX family protein [Rikenellaceae bacterium]